MRMSKIYTAIIGCEPRGHATKIRTGTIDYGVILDGKECEAVIIATDLSSHISIARAAGD